MGLLALKVGELEGGVVGDSRPLNTPEEGDKPCPGGPQSPWVVGAYNGNLAPVCPQPYVACKLCALVYPPVLGGKNFVPS